MIYKGLNRIGMIGDIKTNGGGEIAEVYGGIGDSNPIYYKQREMVGTSPMQFKALGSPLKDYRIYGETLQDGTPSPDMPVDVVGCGAWDETQQSYKLPLTVGGTLCPIYLGQVPTTRRIRKLVLDGTEIEWQVDSSGDKKFFKTSISGSTEGGSVGGIMCSHFVNTEIFTSNTTIGIWLTGGGVIRIRPYGVSSISKDDFTAWLASEYAAGTPVTVWYVLAEPETGIVNEPLMKIGDYADTISFAQAGVTIPTVAGTNTLTVDTTVQPSNVSIAGQIKPVTA